MDGSTCRHHATGTENNASGRKARIKNKISHRFITNQSSVNEIPHEQRQRAGEREEARAAVPEGVAGAAERPHGGGGGDGGVVAMEGFRDGEGKREREGQRRLKPQGEGEADKTPGGDANGGARRVR